VSSIELVLFMPLMFFAIFATVQFGLIYLGNSAASAAARESARVARAGGGTPEARAAGVARGRQYIATVGRGVIENVTVQVQPAGTAAEPEVRAVVRGKGLQVVPGLPAPTLEQVVQGPVEEFRGDL
jgi:Flp pilus assembly protein TadG